MIRSAFLILATFAFVSALNSFMFGIVPLLLPDICDEILYILDAFCPFYAPVLFPAIGGIISIMFTFLISNKVFKLKQDFAKNVPV